MDRTYDCIVAGGGAAGLTAALVLGRARRRVLLVDGGRQSNLPAEAVGGLLAHEDTAPAALYAAGREQLTALPSVTMRDGEVVEAAVEQDGVTVRLADGAQLAARRLLLAAGLDWAVPTLPGAAELWGRSVFHCPFCHGWEVRDARLAVLGAGSTGALQALMLRGWSDEVVLLAGGPAELDEDDRARLAAAGVRVDERPLDRLVARDGALAAVRFADGSELERDGLLVHSVPSQRSELVAELGLELTDRGTVAVDALGRSSVPVVYAAGDIAGPSVSVAAAAGSGSVAAISLHRDLLFAEHGLAVPAG